MKLNRNQKIAAIVIIIAIILALAFGLLKPSKPLPPVTGAGAFNCQVDSDCESVDTECCFNGMPSQTTCMNKAFAKDWQQNLRADCNANQVPCPLFAALAIEYSCSCENQICKTTAKDIRTEETLIEYSGFTDARCFFDETKNGLTCA